MENDFTTIMSQRTDEELIRIVTIDRDGYQPQALLAAEAEISKRNIDTSKIEEIQTNLAAKSEKQKALDESKVSAWVRLAHYIIDTFAFMLLAVMLNFIYVLYN